MTASLKSLTARAKELKTSGRYKDAIALYAQAAKAYPESAVAEHNWAGALGDIGRPGEAEKHIRRAFAKGGNAPQSWSVFARALLAQGKLEEAHTAYVRCVELNPMMLDAQYELAQLIWMTSADYQAAVAPLDEAIRRHGGAAGLYATKARVMMYTTTPENTLEFVNNSLLRWPNDTILMTVGIEMATTAGDVDTALAMSEQLLSLQPQSYSVQVMRIHALLAAGRVEEALPTLELACAANPDNQEAIGLLAVAYRLVGDSRYAELYDYEQLVRPYRLTAPKGWDSLDAYLADLADALRARHVFKTHPFSNSGEHGSMISLLLDTDAAATQAFPEAIAPALQEHLEHLGSGDDPLRSRNTGRWSIDGIWSYLLSPEGFHHDHVHPNGWLSSACYIELPDRVEAGDKEGWIKFGEPGPATRPKLGYEHAVKPEPGLLVLFPSYMWHGTIPFGGDEPRLTVALDIVPD